LAGGAEWAALWIIEGAGPGAAAPEAATIDADEDVDLTGTEGFLTTDEVLAYLQVNLRTVYRLIDAGKLPAVRVGRQWRFRRKDIDAWLDSQRAAGSAADAPTRAVEGSRALVVDPDGPARDLAAAALRDAGWVVDTAPDGPVALDRLQRGGYDLVVAELGLPGLDTFAVVREARRRTPGLRVMIVTAHSTETAAIEALNLGVAGYLVKPSRATEIAATAARILGGHD
jgi:excisionase family DNA binding protein